MISDAQWLAGRLDADLTDPTLTRERIRAACAQAADLGLHGVVVDPVHVAAVPDGLVVSVVVGYPTGRHHSLVKAAEARLAVQEGAAIIWLAVDTTLIDANALLADVVAVRQAVPQPVQLAVITGGNAVVRDAAVSGGANFCVVKHPAEAPGRTLVRAADLGETVEALENGAARVAVANPGAVLAEID
ncbi:hypothetical protein [Corynebacterium guangdongense]|uniref:Deoxyribose-phosphate aldolase n=1 Tax=Corynebacterium guangdongense TaxID=1783348 RepID=A0ABU2A111_9CORY|nr:hypothetical protein [Corynebacterium guangdongense]MDR7330874.1 deoxyribose-phosphate aldolase [Corynebacterium guangdongense]WJZ16889.1 Deoxyribose-phosphate aldolase [Corynebacterium guangdongense]